MTDRNINLDELKARIARTPIQVLSSGPGKDVLAILNRILDQNAQILKALELPTPVIPDFLFEDYKPGDRDTNIKINLDILNCLGCGLLYRDKDVAKISIRSDSVIIRWHCSHCKLWSDYVYRAETDNG